MPKRCWDFSPVNHSGRAGGRPDPDILADLNRMIHEPARLGILTVLSGCATADFTFLQTATGLSKGNLSTQLSRLNEAKLVAVSRTIDRRRTLTMISLTDIGRTELTKYWLKLEQLRTRAEKIV